MPGSFEAVAVILTAIIPGATYVWAVERWVGRWGEGLSDRVLRFTGASAVVHFLLAPFTYAVWRDYFVDGPRLGVGHPFPWPAWLYLGLYLALPAGAGALVGFGQREGWTSIKALAGVKAPKAWDHLFGSRPAGWISW